MKFFLNSIDNLLAALFEKFKKSLDFEANTATSQNCNFSDFRALQPLMENIVMCALVHKIYFKYGIFLTYIRSDESLQPK